MCAPVIPYCGALELQSLPAALKHRVRRQTWERISKIRAGRKLSNCKGTHLFLCVMRHQASLVMLLCICLDERQLVSHPQILNGMLLRPFGLLDFMLQTFGGLQKRSNSTCLFMRMIPFHKDTPKSSILIRLLLRNFSIKSHVLRGLCRGT